MAVTETGSLYSWGGAYQTKANVCGTGGGQGDSHSPRLLEYFKTKVCFRLI